MKAGTPKRLASPHDEGDIHALLDELSDSIGSRKTSTKHYAQGRNESNNCEFQMLLDKLSDCAVNGNLAHRVYDTIPFVDRRQNVTDHRRDNGRIVEENLGLQCQGLSPLRKNGLDICTPSELDSDTLSHLADGVTHRIWGS